MASSEPGTAVDVPSHVSAVGGTTNLQKIQLMQVLNINRELSDRKKRGLVLSYKKYKAINAAIHSVDQMVVQGVWPLPERPINTEIVEIFMSKSFWHSHVSKTFSLVPHYPQMVAWLEHDESDFPSDFEVWHLQKSEYGFKELDEWLAAGGTLDQTTKGKLEKAKEKKEKAREKAREKEMPKGKGKAKAKAKGKGKAKAKAKESDEDEGNKMEIDMVEDGDRYG